MSAYLINHPNNNDKFICNICSDVIDNNKIIGLKCNVKKHVFCFDCINDWYIETKKNMVHNINSNYNFCRMCPICRKNGGYLPNLKKKYIKEVHYSKDLDNIVQTCGYQLKNKDYCMNLGQKCYNNLCKKHYNMEVKKGNIKIEKDEIENKLNRLQINDENNDKNKNKSLFQNDSLKIDIIKTELNEANDIYHFLDKIIDDLRGILGKYLEIKYTPKILEFNKNLNLVELKIKKSKTNNTKLDLNDITDNLNNINNLITLIKQE